MIKKITKKILKKDFVVLLTILVIFGAGALMLWISTFKIPDLKSFDERIITQSTKIYDRTGDYLLYDVSQNMKRTIIPFEEMSPYIKKATIAIEDAEFYQHHGIKPTSILRAVFVNLVSSGYTQGGSTITQQVIKNSILTKEKKISRKIKEWVLAIRLEKVISKDEILAIYLNEAPYGGSIYGIEEASLSFFDKNAKDLNLVESAYLAAIPQAPTYFSPFGENRSKLDERKNLVLDQMLNNKMITEDEYNKAVKETVVFKNKSGNGIRSPHFVMFIEKYLEDKYGEKVLEEGGLKVITSLDFDLQQKGEEIAKRSALQNEISFNAENMAFVAVDVKTGQILSMVGSRDYFDTNIQGNFNITTAHRQPGSAFKPFVYATAFNKGFTPDTVLFNLPTEFSTYCNSEGAPIKAGDKGKCYSPENYDHQYTGPMTLRNALAQSVNIPAVKLLYLTGIKDSLKTAKEMGISGLTNIDQYGLTLVLGGGEVSLLDITSAYAVFANEGIRNPYTGIIKIEDGEGNILEQFKENSTQVLPEKSALYISDILSDNDARAPAFGETSPLRFTNQDVAVKTGTTNDYRDAWTVGYNSRVAVGSWAGNNDNSSMEKKVAGYIITPAWNEFMQEVSKKYPGENFKKPNLNYDKSVNPALRGIWQGGETYFIDKISGKLATENTPDELRVEKVIPNYHSILYWVDKNNPTGTKPSNPANDPQFSRWEYSVQKWVAQKGLLNGGEKPTQYDDIHTSSLAPQIKIIYPDSIKTYDINQKMNVMISNNSYSNYPLTKLNYYINGQFIGSSSSSVFSFLPSDIDNIQDENELKVIGYDSVMNSGEAIIKFKLNI